MREVEVEGLIGTRARVRWDAVRWPRRWLEGVCADVGPLGVGVPPVGAGATVVSTPMANLTASSADLTAKIIPKVLMQLERPSLHLRRDLPMNARKLTLAAALALIAALTLTATPALAGKTFPKLGELAGPAVGESFVHLDSESVAVNDFNSHILVADSGTHVVYDFTSASDTSPTVWTGSEAPAGSFGGLISVAVDNVSGDVYVADTANLVIDKFDASGKLIATFGDTTPTANGQLAGLGTPANSFSHPDTQTPLGIAVNQTTRDLYVIDSGHQVVDVFEASGKYVKQITEVPAGLYEFGGEYTDGIAVNAASGNVFVSDSGTEKVFEFEPLGLTVETLSFAGYVSVAVNDTSGDFYVSSTSPPTVQQFGPSGTFVAQIEGTPGGTNGGVAVDQATGDVYVSDNASHSVKIFGGSQVILPAVTTGKATELRPTSARLTGTVNPEGLLLTECNFEYVTEKEFDEEGGFGAPGVQAIPCGSPDAAEVGKGSTPVTVHAGVTGLKGGETYEFRLVAANANSVSEPVQGQGQSFTTTTPPAIDSAGVASVTSTSADLFATINPDNGDTVYHFEYGTTTSYGTSIPIPDADIGEGAEGVAITQHLSGLSANTTYHWRLLAANVAGTTTTPDHTFVYATADTGLPDNRRYELVTPPQKNGALIGALFGQNVLARIGKDGQRVIAPSIQCFAGAQSCIGVRLHQGEPYQFTRTNGGWVTNPLAPPAASFEANTWLSLNADAGTALFSVTSAPQSGVDDFYARNKDGSLVAIGPFGENALCATCGDFLSLTQESYVSTADLSHVVYQTSGPVWSFDQTERAGNPNALYEYVGAGNASPLLVGVSGGQGSHDLISTCGTHLGGGGGTQTRYGSFSEDGRAVYFTAQHAHEKPCASGTGANKGIPVPVEELYARIDGERAEARTVSISEPQALSPSPRKECALSECETNTERPVPPATNPSWRDASFEGASADGSRVFFTDTQQLTDGASESSGSAAEEGCRTIGGPGDSGCNLYESECSNCNELTKEQESARRRLIDVSEGAKEHGGPRVQGVLAMSADGSHVYFVAKGVLTAAGNARGESAQEEADNMYVYSDAHLAFVTTLSPSDASEWKGGVLKANVTPDGRYLVFTSRRALTPDDTREEGPAQVFKYDAQTRALVRVSIGEGGFNDNGNQGVLGPLLSAGGSGGHAGDASIVEISRETEAASAPVRSDPTMSEDGAFVFFQSPIALTPRALNDVPIGEEKFADNVYEYHEGHVFLISDGKDTTHEGRVDITPTELLGSDASGANVFFATFDRLVPEDTDTQRDFYNAHICSEREPCPPPKTSPAPCEGEACRGTPPGAPANLTPGSESFTGPGNLTPAAPAPPKSKTAAQIRAEKLAKALKSCRKKHGKKRAKCERRAHHAFGAKRRQRRSRAEPGQSTNARDQGHEA